MDRILVLVAASAAVSCVRIDGGAVEASWVVRSDDGRAINQCRCSSPQIASVRFTLVGTTPPAVEGTRPCDAKAACQFPCDRHTGATPFDIPPGNYLISLTPVDSSGQDLSGAELSQRVVTPAPVLREVVRGQPTELDALAIVAGCASDCAAKKTSVCDSP